jgi:hypothetical protein
MSPEAATFFLDTMAVPKDSLAKLQASKKVQHTHTITHHTMRFLRSLTPALWLLAAGAAHAATTWGFDEGTVAVTSKKNPEGFKASYVLGPLSSPVHAQALKERALV